jgi:uncharacterized surface protein with fasciclin (FAS1) repeats
VPSIFDRLRNTQELETFVTGIQLANLDHMLSGTGAFTVFAPHNRAFTSLPTIVLQQLSQDIRFLKRVLRMHILNSQLEHQALIDSYDLGQRKITHISLDGVRLDLDLSNGIKIGAASILSVDTAENGTIYPIDRVLIPAEFDLPQVGTSQH